MKNKQVIILLGPPGSGKGTQAGLLSEKLSLYYFETSKIIEAAISNAQAGDSVQVDGKKYPFSHEKKLWKTGMLCSPPFVSYLVKQKIKELHKAGEGLVLSGSPRTLYETEKLAPFLEKLYGKSNIKVVLIEVSAKESIFRNSHRRICQLMRHPILFSKETANLKTCPLDGSKLLKRKGLDDPETIKVRLKQFKDRTLPLVDYLKERNWQIKKVNGERPVAVIFDRIQKAF